MKQICNEINVIIKNICDDNLYGENKLGIKKIRWEVFCDEQKLVMRNIGNFCLIILLVEMSKKKSAYGRHWISWPMRIVSPLPWREKKLNGWI